MSLAAPALTRPGTLPLSASYRYEVKWDGFRALVSTESGLRVRSRRGWDMTARVPELGRLPTGLVLDGELVALDNDGGPSFSRLSNRILHGHDGIAVTYVVFDVLAAEGASTTSLPYDERRSLIESLHLEGPGWCTAEAFDDGEALFAAVVEQGLEGIVAKRRGDPYRPGQRDWLKIKNRGYWRFGQELESVQRRGRRALI